MNSLRGSIDVRVAGGWFVVWALLRRSGLYQAARSCFCP